MFILTSGGAAWPGDSGKTTLPKDSQAAKVVSVEEFELLKKRLQILEDRDAIQGILSRYSLNVDLGRAEAFLSLFTDDCVFATDVGGKITYRRGKKELGEMLAGGAPPKGQHLQLDYNINIDGGTATAVGYQNLTSLRDNALSMNRAAFRTLKFRRIAGAWLIQEVYTISIDNEAEYLKVLPPEI
jgi:ketosteroid isomerase-like protein